MAEYAWRAVESSGRVAKGQLEATSVEQATLRLKAQGLLPLEVQMAGTLEAPVAAPERAPSGLLARWRTHRERAPVTSKEVLALTQELAVMLRAGLSLAYALRVLIDMKPRSSVLALLQQVLDDVKDGAPLSRALARHDRHFGDFFISMVRAGEASGQLAAVMERLVAHLTRLSALRESVIASATYPAILLVVSVLSLAGMITFVVPQFEKLFSDMGDALPLATRMVLGLSQFVRAWGLEAGIALALLAWAGARWLRTPAGRVRAQQGLLGIPLIGPLVKDFQIVVFARTLGTLVTSGVPLLGALQIAVATVSSAPIRAGLSTLAAPVKSGTRLAQAMTKTGQFEPLAINLVRVGEETGRLGQMLLELADVLDRKVESGMRRALTLLEPALIVVLGALIAGIIISILLGILSINDLAV